MALHEAPPMSQKQPPPEELWLRAAPQQSTLTSGELVSLRTSSPPLSTGCESESSESFSSSSSWIGDEGDRSVLRREKPPVHGAAALPAPRALEDLVAAALVVTTPALPFHEQCRPTRASRSSNYGAKFTRALQHQLQGAQQQCYWGRAKRCRALAQRHNSDKPCLCVESKRPRSHGAPHAFRGSFPGGDLAWSTARSTRNKPTLSPSARPCEGHVQGTCSGLPTPWHPHLQPPSRGRWRRPQTTTTGSLSAFCAVKFSSLLSPFVFSWGTPQKAEIQQGLDVKCKLRD